MKKRDAFVDNFFLRFSPANFRRVPYRTETFLFYGSTVLTKFEGETTQSISLPLQTVHISDNGVETKENKQQSAMLDLITEK